MKALGMISTNYRLDAMERLSGNRPLSATPFGCRYRLIDFSMSNIVNSGIRSVGVILPYRMRPLLDHLSAGKAWNLDRNSGGLFILPSVTPALKPRVQMFCVKDFAANIEFVTSEEADIVVITASNYIVNMKFEEIIQKHQDEGAEITLVYKNGLKVERSVEAKLLMDERGRVYKILRSIDEETSSMEASFADVFIFNKDLFVQMISLCTNSEFRDLLDLVGFGLWKTRVMGYEFKGYMKPVFTVSDYYQGSMDILKPEVKKEIFNSREKILTKTKDSPPTKYETSAVVTNSMVSSGCRLNGFVLNSLIFRNVMIKENCHIVGSVIMQNCIIGENSIIENVIIDKNIKIPPDTVLKGQENKPLYIPKGTIL